LDHTLMRRLYGGQLQAGSFMEDFVLN